MRTLSTRFRHVAEQLGLDHRYIFQNHAWEEEDVFRGYGEVNRRRLREVWKSVDPEGVFQRLMPGFFKLGEGEKGDGDGEVKEEWVRTEL